MTTQTITLTADLERSYFDYATAVITDRALPRVEDGLKPVQRRILYAMHAMGLHHPRPHKKSARVVGETLGKFHPHGDASVYEAMVRMAQDFSLRCPLVDGQGNFGSIDGDGAAAMRYTEARLAAVAETLTRDIEREAIDWTDNFDGSLKEPAILPTVFPNLLVNGSSGVAVGMSTNVPPHNLGEVCDALVYVTQNWARREKITVDDLMAFIPGPDFPTGGVAYRYRVETASDAGGQGEEVLVDTIRDAYQTGRGRIVTQARLDIEQIGGGKADIVVTELPYAVQKSTVMDRIAKEVAKGRIEGVSDLRDESDYTGMRIVVEVARGHDPQKVLAALLTHTQLRETFGVISRALVLREGEPVPEMLSLREMLAHFVEHRLNVIIRRSRHELAEREARLHIVEGLLKALDVIDEVIETIRKSRTTDTARKNLIRRFKFSEAQALAILAMQLRRLAAMERTKLQEEARALRQRIRYLRKLLKSEKERLQVVIGETTQVKQAYATPRRTVILDDEKQAAGLSPATTSDLVKPEGLQRVAITNRGFVRAAADRFSYRVKAGLSARAVEAHLVQLELEPEDAILLVSNRGRAWQAEVGRVPEKGTFADLGLAKGEYIVGGGVLEPGHYLVIGTRAGNVKRTKVEDLVGGEASWATTVGLNGQDEVLFAGVGSDQAEVMFFTSGGRAIRFVAGKVNPQATPSARGVVGIKLGQDDGLVAGAVFEPDKKARVVIVSQAGYAKRVKLTDFPLQGRGGQGVRSLEVTRATGPVAAATVAGGTAKSCDVLSGRGLRYRLALSKLSASDRRKRGRALFEFDADDVIASVVAF